MTLTRLFRKRPLRPGAALEVRVSAPQTIGRVERFRIRKGRSPKATVLCLAPGSDTPRPKC